MPYQVVDAQPSDVVEMATAFMGAFQDNPIGSHVWSRVPYEANHAYYVTQMETYFTTGRRDGVHVRKVINEETGKLVGFAKWLYPHVLSVEQVTEKTKEEEDKPSPPEGTNLELEETFFGALDEKRKHWMDESKDYLLGLLAVHPDHQRHGLGSLLINDGLAVADEHNAKTYIEASPVGLPLYLRHGWRQVDDIVIDLKPYGGDSVASEKCLMRQPGGG